MKIINIVGARPNFMKIAPIVAECNRSNRIELLLVHTGQHYDEKMNSLFFRELGIPEPLGYLDFLRLMTSARVVLTDSGGIQEETTILKVPCLTLRENTERPITAAIGSNQIVGTNPGRIIRAYKNAIGGNWRAPQIPPLWDGRAANRIIQVLSHSFLGVTLMLGLQLFENSI